MESKHLTPISILVGSGIIAAGLFFGLRARPSATVTATATLDRGSATPAPTPPPAPSSDPSIVKKAVADIAAAIQAEKVKTFVPKCWTPLVAKQPQPATSRLVISTSFNAEGKEVIRGVSEERGKSRADVAGCVRDLPIGLTIPAPGVIVNAEIPVEFP